MEKIVCKAASCIFDKTASLSTILFEVGIGISVIAILFLLYQQQKDFKKLLFKFGIMLGGVLIFEIFTSPMWNNFNLG